METVIFFVQTGLVGEIEPTGDGGVHLVDNGSRLAGFETDLGSED